MFELLMIVALFFFGKGGIPGGGTYKGWKLTTSRNGPDGHPDSWTCHGTNLKTGATFDYYAPTQAIALQTAHAAIDSGQAG